MSPNQIPKLLFFVAFLPQCSAAPDDETETIGQDEGAVVYGSDDREDHGAFDAEERRLATSVAAIFSSGSVSCSAGSCTLSTGAYTQGRVADMEWQPLCAGDPDLNKRSGANCTAFLVGPGQIATAGHCISAATMATKRFVFGFNADAAGDNPVTVVPESDVYSCATLTTSYTGSGGSDTDWSLCTLDRLAANRPVLPVSYVDSATLGLAVQGFGHSLGLPLKHGGGATLKGVSLLERIEFNLDVFGGNSGGPLLGANGVVLGITVTNPTYDYTKVSAPGGGFCAQRVVCSDSTGCPGWTRAMRINRLASNIPLFPAGIMATIL